MIDTSVSVVELVPQENVAAQTSQISVLFNNLKTLWMDSQYCELSIILGALEYMRDMYNTHHWTARGDSFYGDHLLFSRLYEEVQEEIDPIAEKSVGVSTTGAVDHTRRIKERTMLNDAFGADGSSVIPDPDMLMRKSLSVEQAFQELLEGCVQSMEQNCSMTLGIDNMIAGIYDTHESHIFLLKQRISK